MDLIEYSKIESNRFEANIFRAKGDEFKPAILKSEIIKNKVDVLILRLPTSTKFEHSSLDKMGFPILHTDSLVYYYVGLNTIQVGSLRNDLTFEIINTENSNALEFMVPIIFNEYQNHYFSNPFFSHDKINQGYVEWATSFNTSAEGKVSWLVKKDKELAGFATCSFNSETKECEGVLYGVMPKFSGQGLYSDIIRFTQKYFKNKGFLKMWVSTQLQNYAVQKVWLREGFFLKKSFETYHINSMLNYSIIDSRFFEFNFSNEVLNDFRSFSGDINQLHFDDEYAIKSGFKSRIAHGMIFQSYLSKYLGVDYPGNGTIFIDNKNLFFAPMYLGKAYKCVINTLNFNKTNGVMKIVAKVYDSEENIILLSYNTIINKNINLQLP